MYMHTPIFNVATSGPRTEKQRASALDLTGDVKT